MATEALVLSPDEKIRKAIVPTLSNGMKSDYQKACEILNSLSMGGLLCELRKIKAMGQNHFENLSGFVPQAKSVNKPRLMTAIAAIADKPPADLEGMIKKLPANEQPLVTAAAAATAAESNLFDAMVHRIYLTRRLLHKYDSPPIPPAWFKFLPKPKPPSGSGKWVPPGDARVEVDGFSRPPGGEQERTGRLREQR